MNRQSQLLTNEEYMEDLIFSRLSDSFLKLVLLTCARGTAMPEFLTGAVEAAE